MTVETPIEALAQNLYEARDTVGDFPLALLTHTSSFEDLRSHPHLLGFSTSTQVDAWLREIHGDRRAILTRIISWIVPVGSAHLLIDPLAAVSDEDLRRGVLKTTDEEGNVIYRAYHTVT